MPDHRGRQTLDEAVAAAYEVRFRAEEEARQSARRTSAPAVANEQMISMSTVRDLEAGAGSMGFILGLLVGFGAASVLWMWYFVK
jgi:hypothetical protein